MQEYLNPIPRMRTIVESAKATGLAPYRVRQLCINGEIAAVRCGRKWLVNLDKLIEYMNVPHPQGREERQIGVIRRISE